MTMPQLKETATERRAEFEATWRAMQGRLTLSGLTEEVLRMSKNTIAPMRPAAAAVRCYPLLAAGLLAGAGWLFRRTVKGAGKTTRRALQSRNPRKGDDQ